MNSGKDTKESGIGRFTGRVMSAWQYVSAGVWSDPRRNWWIKILRTLNLSVQSFLNRDIQSQACAMTYRTMLAVVPALALLLAIGRGFGFQDMLQEELYKLLPAQRQAIGYLLNFVDSYLSQASEGLFVGIGIVFLIYTLISLLGNVEDTFNLIWGQKESRSIWRKISDYTAMLLILPVLMICMSGINLLLSSTLNSIFDFSFMTPVISWILEAASWLMTWLFFTAIYALVPYAKVKFVNAFVSGAIAGTGFLVLQWLFVTGTLYVARYNAIYGSFAFLPLLLLWLQLVWVIVLAGAVICYSSQNVFAFNLDNQVSNISSDYRSKVTIAIAAVFVHRFIKRSGPATARDLMELYDLPARLVTDLTDKLCRAGVLSRVMMEGRKDETGYQLAVEPSTMTVGSLFRIVYGLGATDFIPDFDKNFPGVNAAYARIEQQLRNLSDSIPLSQLEIAEKSKTVNPANQQP
jgi:membrane protein